MQKKEFTFSIPWPSMQIEWRQWLPSRGNVVFMILIAAGLIWAQRVGAFMNDASQMQVGASTISYQGRLADSDGQPLEGSYNLSFALYNAFSGGDLVWGPEVHSAVPITTGVFGIGLGSQSENGVPTSIWSETLFLEITVNGETMSPRDEVRHVPITQMALSVADNSITQTQAPFAPKVYHKDEFGNFESVSKPIIFTGWFHGSDEGYQVHDLSHTFTQIDAVVVTKTRASTGNSNQVNYMVTDASGISKPIPSEIMIHALDDNGNYKAWNQAYFVVYGR